MSDPKVLAVSEIEDFFNDVKSYKIRADCLLRNHYQEMSKLSEVDLISVMTLHLNCIAISEYLVKVFDIESALLDSEVEAFKVSDQVLKSFSEMIVKFVLNKESLQELIFLH